MYTDRMAIEFTYDGKTVEVIDTQREAVADERAEPVLQNPDMVAPADSAEFEGKAPEEVNLELYERLVAEAEQSGLDLTGLFSVSLGRTEPETLVTILNHDTMVEALLGRVLANYRYELAVLGASVQ